MTETVINSARVPMKRCSFFKEEGHSAPRPNAPHRLAGPAGGRPAACVRLLLPPLRGLCALLGGSAGWRWRRRRRGGWCLADGGRPAKGQTGRARVAPSVKPSFTPPSHAYYDRSLSSSPSVVVVRPAGHYMRSHFDAHCRRPTAGRYWLRIVVPTSPSTHT